MNKTTQHILLLVLLAIMSTFYFDGVLNKGPLGVHAWRQADCLSLTKNYADGASFFEPEMHILLADDLTTGKSAGEFPILYYAVGKIWAFTGDSYLSYRLFYLAILILSLFLFYLALLRVLADWYWAATLTLLLYTSPDLVVYGVSFLTDAPAFCFCLIALYFLTTYGIKGKLKWFYISMAFFALAGLIKISSLIAFVFFMFIFLLERFPIKSLYVRKLFKNPVYEIIGFLGVIALVIAWYAYADYYNSIHQFKYTFNSIYPMWEVPNANMSAIIEGVKNSTSISYFSRAILLLLMFTGVFNLFLFKRMSHLAYFANLIVSIGCLLYALLWFPLLMNHNYYFVSMIILMPAVFVPFVLFIRTNHYQIFKGRLTRIFMVIFVGFNFAFCQNVVSLSTKGGHGAYPFIGNHDFVKSMGYAVFEHNTNWKRYERITSYLLNIGVPENAKVISIPDPSFNITLYYLRKKGWSNFTNINSQDEMNLMVDQGASYLLISDLIFLEKEFLAPFITKPIGEFEGVKIYKLD